MARSPNPPPHWLGAPRRRKQTARGPGLGPPRAGDGNRNRIISLGTAPPGRDEVPHLRADWREVARWSLVQTIRVARVWPVGLDIRGLVRVVARRPIVLARVGQGRQSAAGWCRPTLRAHIGCRRTVGRSPAWAASRGSPVTWTCPGVGRWCCPVSNVSAEARGCPPDPARRWRCRWHAAESAHGRRQRAAMGGPGATRKRGVTATGAWWDRRSDRRRYPQRKANWLRDRSRSPDRHDLIDDWRARV
jgi:hypothetical protein